MQANYYSSTLFVIPTKGVIIQLEICIYNVTMETLNLSEIELNILLMCLQSGEGSG